MPKVNASEPRIVGAYDDPPFRLAPRGRYTAYWAGRYSGASSRQLRYWDQIGIVRPSVQKTRNKPGVPRLYSPDDLRRLRLLVAELREGRTLQFIRKSLAEVPPVCPGCRAPAGPNGERTHNVNCWWWSLRSGILEEAS